MGTIHRSRQTFAGDAVDAGAGRCSNGFMTAIAQVAYKSGSNEASASDDNDLHGSLLFSTATFAVDTGERCAHVRGESLCGAWIYLQECLVLRPAQASEPWTVQPVSRCRIIVSGHF